MGVLREVEGQYERFGTGVLNFHPAIRKGGLGDESDFGIEFTENHILVIVDFELSNPTVSAISVEEGGAVGAESRFGAGADGKTENRDLLVAENLAIDNPFCVHSVTRKFIRGDGRTRILLNEVGVLIGFEVELFNQVFPVFVAVLRVVLFAACIECICGSDTSVQGKILGQKVLVHRDVYLMGAKVRRGMQYAVRHYEAVVNVHHRVR